MLSEDEQLAFAIASSMNDGDESQVKTQPEIATVDLTDPKESTMI